MGSALRPGATIWKNSVGELMRPASRSMTSGARRHYIPARYADAHPGGAASDQYVDSDARAAIADAEAILAFVDDAWKRLGG
jgi:HEPN domain-containing protein